MDGATVHARPHHNGTNGVKFDDMGDVEVGNDTSPSHIHISTPNGHSHRHHRTHASSVATDAHSLSHSLSRQKMDAVVDAASDTGHRIAEVTEDRRLGGLRCTYANFHRFTQWT